MNGLHVVAGVMGLVALASMLMAADRGDGKAKEDAGEATRASKAGGAAKVSSRETKPFFARPWMLGAHRGGAALWPENTVTAFRAAAKRWPDIVLETDARLTADGHVVLLHDGTVDRTTDGTGAIDEMTLEQAKRLDAGYRFTTGGGKTFPHRGKGVRIATLAEALRACPENRFVIEFKPCKGITEPALRVIRACQAERRVLLASFDPRIVAEIQRLAPEMAVCYGASEGMAMLMAMRAGGRVWQAYRPAADVLSLMQDMINSFKLTDEDFDRLRAKGVYLQLHTPNTREQIERMLSYGPDSVLTDRPDLLETILSERQTK